jgi:hypothetical protein
MLKNVSVQEFETGKKKYTFTEQTHGAVVILIHPATMSLAEEEGPPRKCIRVKFRTAQVGSEECEAGTILVDQGNSYSALEHIVDQLDSA